MAIHSTCESELEAVIEMVLFGWLYAIISLVQSWRRRTKALTQRDRSERLGPGCWTDDYGHIYDTRCIDGVIQRPRDPDDTKIKICEVGHD